MSFERRVLSLLNLLAAVAVPLLLAIFHLPHGEVEIDYSVLYFMCAALAAMFIVGNLTVRYPSRHGRLLENLPTFFLGTIFYSFIVSLGINFSGGMESPLYYAMLMVPLLAGVCFTLPMAMASTSLTAAFYLAAVFSAGPHPRMEDLQQIAFNLSYLFLACLFSNRLAVEMRRHEQARDEAMNLSDFMRRLEKAKSEFVSVVSHELRTPLTSIQGFSEILANRDMPWEKRREFYEIINSESERLGRLITNLLNLSRIEAGAELNQETLDLVGLLQEDLELQQSQTDLHRLSLEVEGRIPPVYADRDRLHQVFKNLLSNAVKYSPQGGPVVVRVSPEGKYVKVSFADKGIGIPEEELPFIFDRFRRVEKGEAAAISGTGLGLAIVKHLVEMHGGHVQVRSEVGRGSTFTVYIPVGGG
jgi:signal transduction histidine kinase